MSAYTQVAWACKLLMDKRLRAPIERFWELPVIDIRRRWNFE